MQNLNEKFQSWFSSWLLNPYLRSNNFWWNIYYLSYRESLIHYMSTELQKHIDKNFIIAITSNNLCLKTFLPTLSPFQGIHYSSKRIHWYNDMQKSPRGNKISCKIFWVFICSFWILCHTALCWRHVDGLCLKICKLNSMIGY